jgi:CRP-like cAMP-binding protein
LKIKECSLFRSCSEEDLALVEEELQLRSYEENDALITAGESADEMFVLLKGTVEVQIHANKDSHKRVDLLNPGMTVGEMAFLDGSPRSASVVAIEPVDCLVISKAWFESLQERRPSLKIVLLQEMTREISARLRQANVQIAALQRS